MSLTSNNNQSQRGGAGVDEGTNGAGAGTQGEPNHIEGTQDPVDENPTVRAGTPLVGATGTGTITVGGGGAGPVVQAAVPGTQPNVQGHPQPNPNQLILWNGAWPGAKGKIATYLVDNAGTPAAQKETAVKVFDFIKNPNSHLGTIAADTQPIAYLIHVTGTTNIRVVYGLSPIVENPFLPDKPKLFRTLIRDLVSEQDRAPNMMCLPATIVDLHNVEVPTDTFFFDRLADVTLDRAVPWCKTGAAQGAMQDNEKETVALMKIIPVPLYTVVDGFDQDLSAAEVAERLQFLLQVDAKDYLRHALNFCKACATSYGASAKEKIPTIAAVAFARMPTAEDRVWAIGRTVQLCPNLAVTPPARTMGDNTSAIALANSAQLNGQMLTMLQDLMANRSAGGQGGRTANPDTEELLRDTWHGKLAMSKSGVANLLRFCGLQEGEERLIPQIWFRLGEKGMETVDKQRELRRVLENKKTYVDVRAPITAALLKIIAKRDWCEGEMTLTLANIMKGLSIFAMKPLSAEEISTYDAYDDCLDRASSTTIQDFASGSGKRKHHVPSSCYGLETYLKSLINILDAITDAGSPLADDLKFILVHLQKWDSSARAALTQTQIGTMMWVILKESRRFFNGIDKEKCAAFNAMCNHLKGQMPFAIVGLPDGLLETKTPTGETKGQRKRRLAAAAEDKDTTIDLTGGGSPSKPQKVKQERNPIIIEKLGSTITKANKNEVNLSALCDLAGVKLWNVFPDYCGYTALYGKCNKVGCTFKHDVVPDAIAKRIVAQLTKVIDDPTLITGKSFTS